MTDQDRLSRILDEYRTAVAALEVAQAAADAKQRELLESNPDLADELQKRFNKATLDPIETTIALGASPADTAAGSPADNLTQVVNRFEQAWAAGREPDIEAFWRHDPSSDRQSRETLFELIVVDLEHRWRSNSVCNEHPSHLPAKPRLEDYVARYPILGPVDELPQELIGEEYRVRRRWGDQPNHQHYVQRFQQHAAALSACLAGIDAEVLLDATIDAQTRREPPSSSRLAVAEFGDYELLQEIAKGGMGVVYKARQVGLDRIVALKMIRSGELAHAAEVERFHTEARAAAKLHHSGILPIHEIGERDGQHFFTMAYVEGGSLQDMLADGPLSPGRAAEIVQMTAEAMHHAHENGIIHRDLKPANILVDHAGQPMVADFGLAKRLEEDSGLTASGTAMGTPSYMPPEQALGRVEDIGPRADVYSLGAVLYCLVTGRPPFAADNYLETIKQVLERDAVPPRSLNSAIPKDLETICLKCLRKEQRARYSSAAELAEDLQRWLGNQPIKARRVGRLEKSWLWCKRRPAVAGLLATVVLIVGFGSAFFVEQQYAGHARGLVDSLVKADVRQLSTLIDQVHDYGWWTESLLRTRFELAPDDSTEKLHLRLALLRFDDSHVQPLYETLLTCEMDQLGVISGELAAHRDSLTRQLWQAFREKGDKSQRLRAGLTLVAFDPPARNEPISSWTDKDFRFLASELVSAFPEAQPQLRKYLRGIDSHLVPLLEMTFRDAGAGERQQVGAASALVEFASGDLARLTSLATEGTSAQYAVLFSLLGRSQDIAVGKKLEEIVTTEPGENMPQVERVKLGRRRAGAAVTLLRKGEREAIFDAFRVTDDPESLTQFVHRCKDRGVTVPELLECLKRADELRQTRSGAERKREDRVLFGLLLALGEFAINDVPTPQREELVRQLVEWYGTDSSSTIHGAAGWLLRQWGHAADAEKVDRTEMPPSRDREWFVQKIDHESRGLLAKKKHTLYFTFIIFEPGEYQIGSPDDEPYREDFETRSTVQLKRRWAVLDREILRAEYEAFAGRQFDVDEWSPPPGKHPMLGPAWYDSVAFCRALTAAAGMSEADQCYIHPSKDTSPREPQPRFGRFPRNWQVRHDRPGFRIPSEREWEVMCRAGTGSMYYFGSDAPLLNHYGWFAKNSEKKSQLPRSLRPNLRGVFDTYGNANEWCHDFYSAGVSRVLRGGSWLAYAANCRSAHRNGFQPARQNNSFGFRIVRSVN